MITVISGTNRKESRTKLIAEYVLNSLKEKSDEVVELLLLEDLPNDFVHDLMYDTVHQSESLRKLQEKYIIPANKLYFILPEYNGGFPGILKLFIDAISVYEYKNTFHGGKKAALLGISAGRAGNLRGMEHLASVLNYLQITIMPNQQPLSGIIPFLDAEGNLIDLETKAVIESHLDNFLAF